MRFYTQYFADFSQILTTFLNAPENEAKLSATIKHLEATRQTGKKIYLLGNGGSSAIAEHMAIDLTKNAGLKALTISGTPMLTTYANDYGYEKVFSQPLERFGDKGDVVLAISSSGNSQNIVEACRVAKQKEMTLVTFTGFSRDNRVAGLGDINIWLDTKAFGYVEILHNLLIHYINDAIIGSAEYMIKG